MLLPQVLITTKGIKSLYFSGRKHKAMKKLLWKIPAAFLLVLNITIAQNAIATPGFSQDSTPVQKQIRQVINSCFDLSGVNAPKAGSPEQVKKEPTKCSCIFYIKKDNQLGDLENLSVIDSCHITIIQPRKGRFGKTAPPNDSTLLNLSFIILR